jgi:predicted Zn-dependent protease
MKYHLRVIAILALLLLINSCATTGGGPGLNIISPQEEIRLGKELSAEVDKEQPILNDPVLERYVTEVGERVARSSNRPDLPYSFKIIKNEEVNAFSLPGGPIYVYTGLLKFADNEAELASVLAHETAHVAQRHATEQLTRTYGLQVVSSILLGQNTPLAGQVAGNIAGSLGLLKFSRNDEVEADQLGTEYMFRAGYNPTAMIIFHRRLEKLQKSNPSAVLNLFSTHPMSQARVDAIAAEIAKFPPGQNVGYYPERYQQIVDRELK